MYVFVCFSVAVFFAFDKAPTTSLKCKATLPTVLNLLILLQERMQARKHASTILITSL